MQNYYNEDHPSRERVSQLAARMDPAGNEHASRQTILLDIVDDAQAQREQGSYDGSKNDTVARLWGANFGPAAAANLSNADKAIHGSALKGGMSENDLNDYLHNAASGGVVTFTDQR